MDVQTQVRYAAPPPGTACQEASMQSTTHYIPCGRPAMFVVKNRDPHPYAMCEMCADHNARNRGATYVLEGTPFTLAVISSPLIPAVQAAPQLTIDVVLAGYLRTKDAAEVLAKRHSEEER